MDRMFARIVGKLDLANLFVRAKKEELEFFFSFLRVWSFLSEVSAY